MKFNELTTIFEEVLSPLDELESVPQEKANFTNGMSEDLKGFVERTVEHQALCEQERQIMQENAEIIKNL